MVCQVVCSVLMKMVGGITKGQGNSCRGIIPIGFPRSRESTFLHC